MEMGGSQAEQMESLSEQEISSAVTALLRGALGPKVPAPVRVLRLVVPAVHQKIKAIF